MGAFEISMLICGGLFIGFGAACLIVAFILNRNILSRTKGIQEDNCDMEVLRARLVDHDRYEDVVIRESMQMLYSEVVNSEEFQDFKKTAIVGDLDTPVERYEPEAGASGAHGAEG